MVETYIRLKAEAKRVGLLLQTICVNGDEIEVVDEFVYLGSLVTTDNDTSREIQRRIMAGNRSYFGLRRALRSNRVRRQTKLIIYKTLIRPVVLYGHETWTLFVEDQRALGVFERKVLCTIYGGVQMEDGCWRRRMNHELEDNPVKMVLENNPTGSRRRGAQRARWIDQVEGDLRSLVA